MTRGNLIDEFANSPKEVHALFLGFFDGFFGREPRKTQKDAEKEPHYYEFGYFVGWLVWKYRTDQKA